MQVIIYYMIVCIMLSEFPWLLWLGLSYHLEYLHQRLVPTTNVDIHEDVLSLACLPVINQIKCLHLT